jgi:2-C-methyl-D-erythritol 4-phosphate cytidylyltransferase
MSQVSIHALIPAAGISERFGAAVPKQYAELLGKPVLAHSIEALIHHPSVKMVTVVVAEDDRIFDVSIRPSFPDVGTTQGGSSRAHSVLNGLRHILAEDQSADFVLVHDAARPCLQGKHIDDLISAGLDSAEGAILAIPVSDTIKRGSEDNRIEATVSRKNLWQAQTPQMFPVRRLIEALETSLSGTEPPTDEASAMEQQGARPRLVMGSPSNIKITSAPDLSIAESILRHRSPVADQ